MWTIFQLYFTWFAIISCGISSKILDVLPGNGWNGLDSTEQNRIFDDANLTNTFTSPNGVIYMLPSCFDYERSSSDHEEITSQILQNIIDISKLLSFSLDIEFGASFGDNLIKASGSFSAAYKTLKQQIIIEKMLIVKSFRHISHFTIKIPPNMCTFTESFKKSVENLADLVQKNDSQELRRQSYKLLEAFGTHFVETITIGGTYASESSLESSSLNETIDTNLNIKQAAEFKFDLLANGKEEIQFNSSTYLQSFHSRDKSAFARTVQGGDSSKNILNEWVETIDNNYAVVKTQISPLYELFEKQYLQPAFNEQFWIDYGSKLSDVIKNVTLTFYELNAHRGCLDVYSENFNPSANVPDDNACNIVADGYRFGGLFTGKCLNIRNILGGDYKCIANYSQQAVFQNVDPQYNLYFCYTDEHFSTHQTQHVYFGGIYTNVFKNPITKDYTCLPGYETIPLQLNQKNISFCLSRDVTLPMNSLYKFGGTFSSCDYYNPMANGNGCPTGYQEYSLVDYQSCAISYCMNVVTSNYSDNIIYPSDTPMIFLRGNSSDENTCGNSHNSGNFPYIKFNYVLSALIFSLATISIYY